MLTTLAHWVQDQVAAHGYSAVFLLMVAESACIPIPSEVTMVYAGYLVSQGTLDYWPVVIVGAVANLVGSWIAWGVGAYGVDVAWLRTGHSAGRIDQAHRWFERYGSPVVFFSRMLPIVRTFISLPAGIARMPIGRFSLLTFPGCFLWCMLLVWIGDVAGSNWDQWHQRLRFLDYLVVLGLLALVGWWLLRRRRALHG